MSINELYQGYTATLIGGVERADYEPLLKHIGFEKIYRSHNKKDLKKMPTLLKK